MIAVMTRVLGALVLLAMVMGKARAGCEDSGLQSPMLLCKASVTGHNPPDPTQECCDVLKSLSTGCMCVATGSMENLNEQAAMQLPARCGVTIPPDLKCEDHQEFPVPIGLPSGQL